MYLKPLKYENRIYKLTIPKMYPKNHYTKYRQMSLIYKYVPRAFETQMKVSTCQIQRASLIVIRKIEVTLIQHCQRALFELWLGPQVHFLSLNIKSEYSSNQKVDVTCLS